ncbi:unnamed protein product [Prorocentrum cordatum]|uniref:ADP,ATP carrier protein n=1 Tax=Prorocentrum cordatum TaxID=2364126 RepID=A0ABN9PI41_9DINO|nr:unnamed protein product [Polarella glacialis]
MRWQDDQPTGDIAQEPGLQGNDFDVRPGAMVSAAPRGSPATAALLQATAGAGSAVAVAFALHPLELTKTRIQTGQVKGPLACWGPEKTYSSSHAGAALGPTAAHSHTRERNWAVPHGVL